MPDIKTRDIAKGTIKTIDKSAVAAERMKSAFIQTKEKAEHSVDVPESSAEEYASNRLESGIDRVSHEAVLSQMNKPKYGYALVQSLEEKGVAIDPNTLYPLLRRLESQQLLESKWETSGTKPRKYYQRTEYGTQVYEKMKIYWKNLSAGIERLLEEEEA